MYDQKLIYSTCDLGEAAMLMTKGYILSVVDKTSSDRVSFGFFQRDGLDDLISGYYKGRVIADVYLFYRNLGLLKERLAEKH